jgi:hypothetical protein
MRELQVEKGADADRFADADSVRHTNSHGDGNPDCHANHHADADADSRRQ